jgi:hypothetical protein
MVPAMAATGEVHGGTPVDRGEERDHGVARTAKGCGAAGGRVLRAWGMCVWWGKVVVREDAR